MVGIKIRLTCKKCGKSFDYFIVPLASFTSIRLGTHRYMRCPKCKRWSLFNVAAPLNKKLKAAFGR